MKKSYYKKHPANIYIVNGIKYTSIYKLREDLHTSLKRIKMYLDQGTVSIENHTHIYTFNFPLKKEIPYKIGDKIGNKEIIAIRPLDEHNRELMLKLKCLNCGFIKEYHSKTISTIYKTKYCMACKTKLITKKVIYKGKEYDSLTEVSKATGLDLSTVSRHLKRNGNLNTLGSNKNGKESRLLGICFNNKKIIKVSDNKVTVKCLKCGEEKEFSKTYMHLYMKNGKCKNCEGDSRIVYHNIEYKGKVYKSVKELSEKTGEKIGTITSHLRRNGDLNKLWSSRRYDKYTVGAIIANKKILKVFKDSFKVKCLNCGSVFKLARLSLYTMKKDKQTCRYCRKIKKIKSKSRPVNKKICYEVVFRGKTYPSLSALARAFNVSPGKVIGQYNRHNGNLSRLRV